MLRAVTAAVVGASVLAAAGAVGAVSRAPTVSGPLSASSASGCAASSSCAFDYVLDPSATSDPADSWHAYWVSTATSPGERGWCELDAISNLTWGAPAPAPLPSTTYPPAGTTLVGARSTASLVVDAAGNATTSGRLVGRGAPPGLVTTWVHRGYMTTLWQGRATNVPSLVLAAELRNPAGPSPSPPGRANDYGVGLPCSDVAPPGATFLARFAKPTIRLGQTAYLELRIPDTGLRWTITPKLDEQSAVDGRAVVQMVGHLGALTSRGKPQTVRFADRYTAETKPGFGVWTAIVTLQGPTGVRHYRIPLTVKA